MKKMTTLLLLCGLTCSFVSFSPIHPRQKTMLHTIIIDPGHGGLDPGCRGLFSREKDVTLAISLKLGKAIQEAFPDVKIVYTRTTDILPGNMPSVKAGLHYRADLANQSKGDLFICIHANSNGKAPGTYPVKKILGYKTRGKGRRKKRVPIYETYYVKNTTVGTISYIWKAMWGEKKGEEINNIEDMGDSTATALDLSSPEAKMRARLYEKKYFGNSALFAQLVESEFEKSGRQSEGVGQRDVGLWVLEATGMPSVLIETGYLTNKEEEEYLNSKEGQNEVVRNILDALKRYNNSLEGHGDTGGPGISPKSTVRTKR